MIEITISLPFKTDTARLIVTRGSNRARRLRLKIPNPKRKRKRIVFIFFFRAL